MESVDDFYNGSQDIVKVFDDFSATHHLTDKGKADHICYKCSSSESFENIRRMFEPKSRARWVYQSIIAGRRIALIRLVRPIETELGEVDVLELSDQKPDGSQSEGFDHIEVYPVYVSYDRLVSYLRERKLEVKEIVRPHHTTHDILIGRGYLLRLTREGLIEKVTGEMRENSAR